ncbi:hypothetical protein [Longibacter sp.]|jgi:hypothetical protein|uniref:hypothetical protein n=1 Tax=Longibacter sp. TaxID=2045415 RepID=UPI003EB9FA16
MANEPDRPNATQLLSGMILFQAVSGIAGGTGLMVDPTGASLGIPNEWLTGSLFDSYLIPGLSLFIVLGWYPLAAWIAIRRRWNWAWPVAFSVGVALIIWIGVDIAIIGYHAEPPLQLISALLGLAILALALSPSIRDDLRPDGPGGRSARFLHGPSS